MMPAVSKAELDELKAKIGLEVHLELNTRTKMFCPCVNDSLETHPNTNICPICTGQPGALPSLNRQAVVSTLKFIQSVGGAIQERSIFARKNYFYPDLPKGYQISQYESPLGVGGELVVDSERSERIRIRRIHLEEDTGKLIHAIDSTLVDFNRSGVPLVELVTEPDLASAEVARAFVEELMLLIRYLNISGANLERGEIRLVANISVGPGEALGTKVEVKNLNSIAALEGSIRYEIERHKEAIASGEKLIQETRGWDEAKQRTFSQRTKEEAEDYRYFPEPDLPPLVIDETLRAEVILPELPAAKRQRFQTEFNLASTEAANLVRQPELANFFEEAVSEFQALNSGDTKLLYNYLANDLAGLLAKFGKALADLNLTPHTFGHLISLVAKGEFGSKMAKDILLSVVERGEDIEVLIRGTTKLSDEGALRSAIEAAIAANPKAVDDYRKGKGGSIEFLIGQVMKQTKGQADIELTRRLLQEALG